MECRLPERLIWRSGGSTDQETSGHLLPPGDQEEEKRSLLDRWQGLKVQTLLEWHSIWFRWRGYPSSREVDGPGVRHRSGLPQNHRPEALHRQGHHHHRMCVRSAGGLGLSSEGRVLRQPEQRDQEDMAVR